MGLELELDNIDSLDDATKSLYVKDGDKFKLNAVVAEFQSRVGKMDSKISELLKETKQFKGKARDAAEQEALKAQELEDKKLADLEKNKDFDAYKKSMAEKHDKELNLLNEQIESFKKIAISQSSGHDAMKMASDIALTVNGVSTAGHLEPQFAKRLRTNFVEGKAVVEVLDAEGNLSAMTQKELSEEIKNLPENAMLITGSKGNGAGLPANNGGFNGGIDVSKMTPRQKIEYARQ